MIAAHFVEFGKEAGKRKAALLAFAEHIAVIGDALLCRKGNLYDTTAEIASIGKTERDMCEMKRGEFVFERLL